MAIGTEDIGTQGRRAELVDGQDAGLHGDHHGTSERTGECHDSGVGVREFEGTPGASGGQYLFLQQHELGENVSVAGASKRLLVPK